MSLDNHDMSVSKLRLLDVFIGRWITNGKTIDPDGSSVKIHSSDIYEWAPGGFFVIHTAYGGIGEVDVGGVEIIGFDGMSKKFDSHLFDNQDNIIISELTEDNGIWTWNGPTPFQKHGSIEQHRATVEVLENGKFMTAYHEISDDGENWKPCMDVKMTKVE
jgi:hypothetical protein